MTLKYHSYQDLFLQKKGIMSNISMVPNIHVGTTLRVTVMVYTDTHASPRS